MNERAIMILVSHLLFIGTSGATRHKAYNTEVQCSQPPPSKLECWEKNENDTLFRKVTSAEGSISTDYLLFVDAEPDFCAATTLAWAAFCQMEDVLNRPIAGEINFCPLSTHEQSPEKTTYFTALHEIAHALGFASPAYAYMRDQHGQPRTPRRTEDNQPALGSDLFGTFKPSNSTLKEMTVDWMTATGSQQLTFSVLRTPNLLRELMAGSVGDTSSPSPLTLAYFRDTGWYYVKTENAEKFMWGAGNGCDFLFKSCHEYMKFQKKAGKSFQPWCDRILSNTGICEPLDGQCCDLLNTTRRIPPFYQHFSDKRLTGTDMFTDNCPYEYSVLGRAALIAEINAVSHQLYPVVLLAGLIGITCLSITALLVQYVRIRRKSRSIHANRRTNTSFRPPSVTFRYQECPRTNQD